MLGELQRPEVTAKEPVIKLVESEGFAEVILIQPPVSCRSFIFYTLFVPRYVQ